MIGRGRVFLPGPDGPETARTADGGHPDILDVADFLNDRFHRVYVVDLDGIDHDRPQLDYLQEIAKDSETWVDAGVRTGDQAIDVLVTGARRAVLSTSRLGGIKEVRRAWRLSQDLVFEIEVTDGQVPGNNPEWTTVPITDLVATVRATGVKDLILSPRGCDVDWALVRQIATQGPIWVAGTFESGDATRLRSAGAAGGIFHINREIAEWHGTPENVEPVKEPS